MDSQEHQIFAEKGDSEIERESKGQYVTLFHVVGIEDQKAIDRIKKEGLKSSAILYREGQMSFKWPGNKGYYVFLTDSEGLKDSKGRGSATVEVKVPKERINVANILLHNNNSQQWESSFMSFDAYQQKRLELKDYSPEFLVLGTIPPENIVSVEKRH